MVIRGSRKSEEKKETQRELKHIYSILLPVTVVHLELTVSAIKFRLYLSTVAVGGFLMARPL